jgi:hypothetical protein
MKPFFLLLFLIVSALLFEVLAHPFGHRKSAGHPAAQL